MKAKLTRLWSFLLALVMVAGLVPAMSGRANKVQAASGSGTAPSVSAYATKTQLMDGTFAPNADGAAVKYGKIVFGKNSSGASQEWYILGKDEGVSGDNTIIFAASPIATNQVFENDKSNNKAFQSSFGVYESDPSEVYPNHYGASDLRVALQRMLEGESGNTVETYFTSAEQGLMNATTVKTKDIKNSVTYTTTDKLYALQGELAGEYLCAGTGDSTVLAMNSYWSSGADFWLRSTTYNDSRALVARPGVSIYNGYVNSDHISVAVQPASNLNLKSVFFASAATAASSDTVSGTITDGTAMTLRLNGTGKDIGTVTYNNTTGDIKATKGSTEGDVALVVQGNDGTNDWYYSKKIDTSETVNASAIKSALGLTSDIDLSDCKIWLEITDTDGLIYSVGAEIEIINATYATKTQLMDGTFAPNSDGTATNIGKLVFGKNSSGASQEWYILGKDEGVSGDNTIIFAASPISENQKFENDAFNKKAFQSSFGVYKSKPSEVSANHYGASDLRAVLQRMLEDESGNTVETYFTTAEQCFMNPTTVTTQDPYNSVTYTTTDKLYALQGDFDNNKYLWAGTGDSTVLARDSYWSSGADFWLRSPRKTNFALLALTGNAVGSTLVDNGGPAVQPASNLNLSSVLFASAATAASSDTVSGTITDGTAMTLRLDGTGKGIGTVTYNNTTGDIKATKGSTEGDVALVVQGNDGTSDWYYSKKIGTSETVNASAIKSALGLSSDIDLSTCKIWLEITGTEGLIYAVGEDKEIEKINTTYVTKEQLMNSFKPYSDGTAVNYGKLVFGKNSSGASQEWYILGKDEGVSGDNTIIFAASPIATNQVFENDKSNNKAFQSSFGVYESDPSEVYPNHYGASDLRAVLQRMLKDESGNTVETYFNTAEQGLMNPTTVTTKDTKNSVTYTTTDTLYALQGFCYAGIAGYMWSIGEYLWAGTGDSTVLAMNSYWSSGDWFWLRSPADMLNNHVMLATPDEQVYASYVGYTDGCAVQPASNLNLSSVLFASAATAASSDTVSGTITDGTAMTLRLDGTGKGIGTVTYNNTTGDIKATKGSTEGDVALVVQGNDGTSDWYYSKQITGTEIVKVSDIVAESNTPSSIDLSTCKIWLEITDTDGLIYAVGTDKEQNLRGDANMDGKISLMDVNRIIRHLASWSVEINLDNADYDANGKVNLIDVSKLIKLLAGK